MEPRTERDGTRSKTIVEAWTSLALWLRTGRTCRGMSLDDVAKVTKIQPRILERIEAGKLDGLPADVFVRGFVRSFARCVGLDENEALRRYAACSLGSLGAPGASGAVPSEITPTARALVEAMADLVSGSATVARATPRRMSAVEVIDLAAGSLRALAADGLIVETMMLPETGTVVMPVQLTASLAEATTDSDPIAASTGSPSVARPADTSPPGAAITAATAVEPVALSRVNRESTEAAQPHPDSQPSQKRRTRRGRGRNKRTTGGAEGVARELLAVGTPAGASLIVTAPVIPVPVIHDVRDAPDACAASDACAPAVRDTPDEPRDCVVMTAVTVAGSDAISSEAGPAINELIVTATWAPKMPPNAAVPSVPWRKPAYVASSTVVVPTLVIDDADPDSAERVLEDRAEKHAPRRSFLPPILLDREDRSARQGGLTLAVIILLIAATLTLSYLMRRPSAGGDGMTRLETPAGTIGSPDWGSPARGSPARG
jgi:hypothetical protein